MISKCEDAMMRTALYEAAQVLRCSSHAPPEMVLAQGLGMQVARRRGGEKGIVALARRLAVILHRMWADGTQFRWHKEVNAAA